MGSFVTVEWERANVQARPNGQMVLQVHAPGEVGATWHQFFATVTETDPGWRSLNAGEPTRTDDTIVVVGVEQGSEVRLRERIDACVQEANSRYADHLEDRERQDAVRRRSRHERERRAETMTEQFRHSQPADEREPGTKAGDFSAARLSGTR
jgi:hypothetical protein